MKTNPLKDGIVTENSAGIGTATPAMVRAQAAELAIIDGHLSGDATQSHFAQANDRAQTSPLLGLWQGAQDRLYSRLFQS